MVGQENAERVQEGVAFQGISRLQGAFAFWSTQLVADVRIPTEKHAQPPCSCGPGNSITQVWAVRKHSVAL